MTSAIGLFSVLADIVILMALAAAVASPRVSSLARPVIATVALACAWLIAAVFDAMRAPGWTVFLGGAAIVVSIVLIIATLHIWTQGSDGTVSGQRRRGDHGGGGPGRGLPDAPHHGGGGSDPSWWPEFERQLASCVAEREKEKGLPAVLPAEPAPYAITRQRGKESLAEAVHLSEGNDDDDTR